MLGSLNIANYGYKAVVCDCAHKYRFDDNIVRNFIFALKLSPAWLLLSVLRNAIFKRSINNISNIGANGDCKSKKSIFTPTGAEFQYYNTSIDLDAIPFEKRLIK